MKRKLPVLVILILLFTLLAAVSAEASFRVQYSRNGQEATASTADSVQIVSVAMEYGDPYLIDGSYCYPSTYGNLPVTGLLSGACDGLWSSITSITLPSSLTRFNVTDVPDHIEKIVFPDAFDNTTADQVVRYSYPQLTSGYDRYYANAGTKTAQELRAAGIAFRDIGTGQWISQSVYSYTLEGGMATLTTYTGSLEYINVPHMIDSQYPVVAIGNNLYKNRTSIKSVFIPDGVLSIGDNAFAGCTSLTEVTMNCMCDNLGAGAFAGCTSLKTVHIPESAPVTEIKSGTFAQCSKLSGVYYIPASVTAIRENAFAGCTALKNVYIPWRTREIDDSAFDTHTLSEGYSLTGYTGSAAETYAQSHGYSFDSWGALLTVSFDPGYYGSGQMDPIKVSRYTDVTVPECSFTNTSTYYSPAPEFVHWISGTTIYEPGDSLRVTEDISLKAIWSQPNHYVTLAETTGQYSYNKVYYNDVFVFPDPVIEAPEGCTMLWWESGLEKRYKPGDRLIVRTEYQFSPVWIKALPDNISWSVTDGVLTITGVGAIDSCEGILSPGGGIFFPWYEHQDEITSIVVGEGITGIGRNAFLKLKNVENISLPSTIAADGVPFDQLSGTVTVHENNPYMASSGDCVWEKQTNRLIYCSETGNTITIPDGIAVIGSGVFSRASFGSMKTLNVPVSVTTIEAASITNTSLRTVNYGGTRAQWDAVQIGEGNTGLVNAKIVTTDQTILPKCGDNITWELDNKTLILAGTGPMYDYTSSDPAPWRYESITSLVIPEGITTIGNHAFTYKSITDLALPGSISHIGSHAFEDCSYLESITLSQGLKTIGDYAFSNCSEFYDLYIPDGVTTIGNEAFSYCTFLNSVRFPVSLTSIGSQAFDEHWNYDPFAITYAGTQKQWLQVSVHKNHDWLEGAVFTYQQQDVEVESFAFADDAPYLAVGETFELSIIDVHPENAILALTWTSLDETVLTVDDNGIVTGVYPGIAVVTATDLGGTSASISILVNCAEHVPMEPVTEAIVEPTCSADGHYDEVIYCSVCGKDFFRTTYRIDRLDHTPGDPVRENEVSATCSVEGSYDTVVKCSVCGEEISRTPTVIGKLDHTPGEAVRENEVPATCSAEGSYDAVVKCSVCGEEISRTPTVIIKLGHTPGEPVRENEVSATCSVEGSYDAVVKCSVCGEEISRTPTVIGKLDHTPDDPARENEVPATCSAEGSYDTVVKCSVCGEEISRTPTVISKLNHTPDEPVRENEVAATCTAEGSYDAVIKCSVCGEEISRTPTVIGKLDHTPGDPVRENEVPATDSADGSYDEVTYCTVCGAEVSREQKLIPRPQPQQPTGPQAGSYSDSTGNYEVSADGTATYKGPAKDQATVTIPATIKVGNFSVPVTKIADKAFKGKKKLKTVTIGSNIKEIGTSAFEGCKKLKTVKGGANVEKIGAKAFKGCVTLTKYTISAKVNFIGKSAFYGCTKLKTITVKSTLLTNSNVKSGAFKKINAKATFKVPKSKKKEYKKWLPKKGTKTVKVK